MDTTNTDNTDRKVKSPAKAEAAGKDAVNTSTSDAGTMDKAAEARQRTAIKRLVTMALFAALLSISAYINIPLPLPGAPHITLCNFMILLIALLLPAGDAFLTILVWMLLGIIGIPVFIGGTSGIGYLLLPYGGYTVVFPLIGLILPLLRGKGYHRLRYTIAAIVGAVFIDIFGMFWLMHFNQLSLTDAFLLGFVPFIALDIIKAVAAAQIVPAFRKIMSFYPEK